MKKQYEKPEAQVIAFQTNEDIAVTGVSSGTTEKESFDEGYQIHI